MIRRGKTQGWLTLQPAAFSSWARLNEVDFRATRPATIDGRGSALVASRVVESSIDGAEMPCLLKVPQDLILSISRVQEHAKIDRDFREVLESLGDFGKVGLDDPFHLKLIVTKDGYCHYRLRCTYLIIMNSPHDRNSVGTSADVA